MRIKHKYTKEEKGVSYRYWKNDILKNHLEDNYEILSKPDLVDVYMVNSENGKLTFVETTDRTFIEDYFAKGKNYVVKETDLSKFDEIYRLKENQMDLLRFKNISYNLPTPKEIIHKSINSTISKWSLRALGIIISVSLLPIVSFIIWELYRVELIKYWKFIFK
nr:hypothetical protein [uncultured Flavobacterium sp.]